MAGTNAMMNDAFQDVVMGQAKRDFIAQQRENIEEQVVIEDRSKADTSKLEEDIDDDDLLDDDDPEIRRLRDQRIAEMKQLHSRRVENMSRGHGQYLEIDESEFLKEVTSSELVVCHFYHREFERCRIVDKHLALIAPNHIDTKFIKINADKAPFFVTKLAIKMLPTIVIFQGGVAVDRIVGFDELGARDDFSTAVMAKRLADSGVIKFQSGKVTRQEKAMFRFQKEEEDDEE
eukprot:GILK01001623.1.p1 GENE.GILK01001623.1~~GILK01001623.1.p1  ORF type:complete len:248 (-),score=56.66 GILK01001623.1:84-782(-)